MWTMRHSHRRDHDGRSVDCRRILRLSPQPAGTGGPLCIIFADGPGRYVPGGAPFGSGDVGFTRGADLNLHEPGAVRALLDGALARGWQPGERRVMEVDGWSLPCWRRPPPRGRETPAPWAHRGAAPFFA